MKQVKDIKHILSVLGISTLFALLLFLITSVAFSYRKAETIEKLINDFHTKDLVIQGIGISMQDGKFKCDSSNSGFFNSQITCQTNDLNISIENIPAINIKSVIITSETPALKTSIQDILQNFKAQIKLNKINFADEILGIPQFVDQNITTLFNESIVPQLKNIDATLSYSQKNFQRPGFVAPIEMKLELKNLSSSLSFKLQNHVNFYKQPLDVTFATPLGERSLTLSQEAFFDSAKVCWKIKKRDSLMRAFYDYYQAQYLMSHGKGKFNDFYLDVQDEALISLSQFQEQISKLLGIAIAEQDKASETEFMARENASILEMFFPFLQSFFQGNNEMCQTLSASTNKSFSLTQMNYRLQSEGEESFDEIISQLNTTFTIGEEK